MLRNKPIEMQKKNDDASESAKLLMCNPIPMNPGIEHPRHVGAHVFGGFDDGHILAKEPEGGLSLLKVDCCWQDM